MLRLALLLTFLIHWPLHAGEWPLKIHVYRGATPTLDGAVAPGEYADAARLDHAKDWTPQYGPIVRATDLDATVWVKHDGRDLYFAFDVSDDIAYGRDTPAWLPADNPFAHELSQRGWPWFGDAVQVLINPPYRWITNDFQLSWGGGSSWHLVASSHKSLLGGTVAGGLLPGGPLARERAWTNYRRWIGDGAMEAVVRPRDGGYVVEWKISADPCLEIEPGLYWSPDLGARAMGLNLAVSDLDGEGDRHENWWAGERDKRVWLKQWGTMVLMPGPMPDEPDTYPPGTAPVTPRVDQPLVEVPVEIPSVFAGEVPDDLTVQLPPGFTAKVFAAPGLRGPRSMAWSPEGVLHVANMKAGGAGQFTPPNDDDVVPPAGEMTGQIIALPDRDGDGVADTALVAVDNLWWATNLQFYQGDLYAGDRHAVRRFSDTDGDGVYETEREPLALLPPSKHHRTRTIVFDEQNDKLYVSVGSSCDLCWEEDAERAAILEFNADGSGRRVYATGLRNAVGMTLHPRTNELWATDNGHDREGRSLPPEMVDVIRDGGFYGWPLAYGYRALTSTKVPAYNYQLLPYSREDSLLIDSMRRPAALFPAHLAPMDIHFYTGALFPDRYRDAGFVALRGGSNAGVPGFRVMALHPDADARKSRVADFLAGFERNGTVWGKPVGITSDSLGHLYVSSDWINHLILRIGAGGLSGTWQQAPPQNALSGTALPIDAVLRVDGLDPQGEAPSAIADLSALGGPAALPLAALDDSTFRLRAELALGDESGEQSLLVYITQQGPDPRRLELRHRIQVKPAGDLFLFADAAANGWNIVPIRPERVDLQATGRALSGESAIALDGDFRSLAFEPPIGFSPGGFDALAFSVHPGAARLPEVAGQLSIGANVDRNGLRGRTIQLLKGGVSGAHFPRLNGVEVDLSVPEWQEVVIPLREMRFDELKWIRLIGAFDGGPLYIDDVRLVISISGAGASRQATVAPIRPSRIIDTHIHLFDPARPEGVPWPQEGSELYRPTLPADFRATADPAGVSGTVVVEASPWLADNQWLLDITEGDDFFHAIVGNLDIAAADFAAQLDRFAADPRFVGIRAKRFSAADLDDRAVANLRLLAERGLVLDILMANMGLADVRAIADAAPDLPIIINHAGGVRITGDAPGETWIGSVRETAARPNVHCKISGLFQQSGQAVAPLGAEYYAPVLDALWQAFGPERLVYGSNWPVSNLRGDYAAHQDLVLQYFSRHGARAVEQVMWRNAVAFYRLERTATAVVETRTDALPRRLALEQNYPNPFNSATVIRFALPRDAPIDLAVYNLTGQRVATLAAGPRRAGSYEIRWEGRDTSGKALASGLYLYRLRADSQRETRKLLLLR